MPMKPVDTAIVVTVGPLIDDDDFKARKTMIAHDEGGMDADLFIETATGVTKTDLTLTSGGSNDWTHKGGGYYEVEISDAQNDTEGALWVAGICNDVLAFESPHYEVVPANVYNSLIAGGDQLEVDTTLIEGADATDAINAACDTALSDYDAPTKAEMDSGLAALNDLSAAQVNAEVDAALADYDAVVPADISDMALESNAASVAAWLTNNADVAAGLATYDPPTKAELDAGLAALNDLSAAEVNAQVDTALADYDGPTKAELDTAESNIRGADGDTLKALSDQIDAIPTAGDGAVMVDHDTGGTDALAYKTAGGIGIDGATVLAFTQANWDAGNRSDAHIEGQTTTDVNGRWQEPMRLDAATYVFYFNKQGQYGPDTQEQAVS